MATWAILLLTVSVPVSVPAFAGVLKEIVRSYKAVRIRRDRYDLIREVLKRGDATALLIVAVTTSEQGRELQENHDSKEG